MPPHSPAPITLDLQTRTHAELVDLTARIAAAVPPDFSGLCHVFCLHTTAGLTLNENADPDVVHDLLAELERLVPWHNPRFRHREGNSAAHLKASLMGAALTIPVERGALRLGTWQAAYFCEFDGPRQRRVTLHWVHAATHPQGGQPG
jgi:secondary thiamine-phosphate synthase enzyme